jgi:hypothetical protein
MDSHQYKIYVDAETKQLIEDVAASNSLSGMATCLDLFFAKWSRMEWRRQRK